MTQRYPEGNSVLNSINEFLLVEQRKGRESPTDSEDVQYHFRFERSF